MNSNFEEPNLLRTSFSKVPQTIPEHLLSISPNSWSLHWHSERLNGDWGKIYADTEIVLKQAEAMNLSQVDLFLTRYTHLLADFHLYQLHGKSAEGIEDHPKVEQLRGQIHDLREDYNISLLRDPSLERYLVRLEGRIIEELAPSKDSFLYEPCISDPEWLSQNGISADGLTNYLQNQRAIGADAAAIFLCETNGTLVKLAEYRPRWIQDENRDAIPSDMMSSTKSVTALICFIAANRGYLDLDQPITEILKEKLQTFPAGWDDITCRHLLNQTAGLACNIDYNLLHTNSSFDAHLAVPLEHPPGTSCNYSNAGTQMLAFVLDQVLRKAGYNGQEYSPVMDFAGKLLFNPLDMTATRMTPLWDLPQIPLVDRGLQSTVSDFAKIARLILAPESILAPDNIPSLTRADIDSLLQPASTTFPLLQEAADTSNSLSARRYANCFYLTPYGIATRGTYNTSMEIVARPMITECVTDTSHHNLNSSSPHLVFVRQQLDAGFHDPYTMHSEHMLAVWETNPIGSYQ